MILLRQKKKKPWPVLSRAVQNTQINIDPQCGVGQVIMTVEEVDCFMHHTLKSQPSCYSL